MLPRYERRQEKVNETMPETFLTGVSARKIQEVIESLLVAVISA